MGAMLKMIGTEAVQERHFFLESINNPAVFNGIRLIGAGLLLFFIISYFWYKKR